MSTATHINKSFIPWFFWVVLMLQLLMIRVILGAESPEESPVSVMMLAVLVPPMIASVVVRWGVLPRLAGFGTRFPLYIVGLALSESIGFIGLFLFPYYQDACLILSGVLLLQYCPAFTRLEAEPA